MRRVDRQAISGTSPTRMLRCRPVQYDEAGPRVSDRRALGLSDESTTWDVAPPHCMERSLHNRMLTHARQESRSAAKWGCGEGRLFVVPDGLGGSVSEAMKRPLRVRCACVPCRRFGDASASPPPGQRGAARM
jgi:hypothetical protein